MAPPSAKHRLRALIPAARKHGIAALTVRNAAHIGMVGYYAERRAQEGLVCIAFTTTEVLVHPFGGAEALVGTNPIAIGIPGDPRPFLLDMATSVSAMGRIIAFKHRGEKIPEGWAVDKDGNPTTDPDAALHGSLSPAGGPKGYGLGICDRNARRVCWPGMPAGREVLGTLDTEYRCTVGDLFIVHGSESISRRRNAGSRSKEVSGRIDEHHGLAQDSNR